MLVVIGAVALSVCLVGCGDDQRAGKVDTTVQNINTAAIKLTKIKEEIEKAIKGTAKAETGKSETEGSFDFKPALTEIKSLKEIATQMLHNKMWADAHRDQSTPEERQALTEEYRDKINSAIEKAAKARKELETTLVEIEKEHKGALVDVRKELTLVDGEFETIARQQR
jgi:outer membrane murein-binding lipoprotein Lpp